MLSSLFRRKSSLPAIALAGLTLSAISAQVMPKAQVGNLIAKVENGVDEFKNYLEKRGDSARDGAATPDAQSRRGTRGQATDSQKATVTAKKDELTNALDDLDRSTNRLRRKFDATDKWMETKSQVQQVVDDGRRINQAVTKGNYGADAARLWGVLRTGINDLARAYAVSPLGV
jgi:peptidoglycan hydrolase CwlO-like protein